MPERSAKEAQVIMLVIDQELGKPYIDPKKP
jgi:hypothetical protein